jgi:type I restriction enzyme S subunit
MKKNISSNDITSEELEKLYKFSPAFSTEAACQLNKFSKSGFADRKLNSEVKTGEEQKFWANHAEALVFEFLTTLNFKLVQNTREAGPDFEIDLKESSSESSPQKLWVEVICPSPKDLPDDWLNGTGSPPLDKLLLKITAAIKEKTEKFKGYLDKKIIQPNDHCVIAINLCQLHDSTWPRLPTISTLSITEEVVEQLGCLSVKFEGNSKRVSGVEAEHRSFITKSKTSNTVKPDSSGKIDEVTKVGEKNTGVEVPLGLSKLDGGGLISAVAELSFSRLWHLTDENHFSLTINKYADNPMPDSCIDKFKQKKVSNN